MEESLKYTRILRALMELPFQVGRNLLADFLIGDYSNKSISKSRLDELDNFGKLNWDRGKIFGEIDRLIANGMIEMVQSDYNRFVKVLSLTIRGRNEITHPTLEGRKLGNRVDFGESVVSDEDRERFAEFGNFLEMFNDEQRKAIISGALNLLCVAGAGSGKTTVLTKRIEFLVKYKGVDPESILAITFTRKARLEMKKRLGELGVVGVQVHTFNSFCEGILQKYGTQIYGRAVRVQGYGDKILAMNMALATIGLEMEQVVDEYFSAGQKKFRTASQLANAFMNDCFAVMDYFKVSGTRNSVPSKMGTGVPSASGKEDYDWSRDVDGKDRVNAERIYRITQYLREHMETQGLRDYSDQIIDTIKFFKEYTEGIPNFEYVLIDEYQDVNAMQIELIGLLKPRNLFAVGDPRQSIFGWRGSDVNYILNFEKDFGNAEVVHLKKNYRSFRDVVTFMNHAIRDMGLPDLQATLGVGGRESGVGGREGEGEGRGNEGGREGRGRIRILDFESEDAERDFVLREIEDSDVSLDEIFVLARTNKILMELSRVMKERGILHVVRADESSGRESGVGAVRHTLNTLSSGAGRESGVGGRGSDGVTLATVHAIKGLEAKKVFVIGVSEQNFPCKASDHPAIEMVKRDDYDREEEERRLFYVAVSRAREELIVTHSGKRGSYYITPEMRNLISDVSAVDGERLIVDEGLAGELKSWRSVVSEEGSVPVYTVLTNKTIDEIAEKRPESAEELMKISGIGPGKLMRYGERILGIIGDFEGGDGD